MIIPRGNNGITPVFSTSTSTSTLSAGSSATASISGSGTSSNPYKFSFGIPRGSTGSQGPTGPSAISASNLTTNGYIKFTNGLIIQWARMNSITRNTSSSYPINFNTPFITTISMYTNCHSMGIIEMANATYKHNAVSTYNGSSYSFSMFAIGT